MASSYKLSELYRRAYPKAVYGDEDPILALVDNKEEPDLELLLKSEPFVTFDQLKFPDINNVPELGFFRPTKGIYRNSFVNQRERGQKLVSSIYRASKYNLQNEDISTFLKVNWMGDPEVQRLYAGSITFTGPVAIGKSTLMTKQLDGVPEYGIGGKEYQQLSYFARVYDWKGEAEILRISDFNSYIENYLSLHKDTDNKTFSFHANVMYREILECVYHYVQSCKKTGTRFLIEWDRFLHENVVFYVLYDWEIRSKDQAFIDAISLFWPTKESLDVFWALYPAVSFLCFQDYNGATNARKVVARMRTRGRPFEEALTESSISNFYRAFLACTDKRAETAIVILKSFDISKQKLMIFDSLLDRWLCEFGKRKPIAIPKPTEYFLCGFNTWRLWMASLDEHRCSMDNNFWLAI